MQKALLTCYFENTIFYATYNNKKVLEDAVFGFRAAGPALLSNKSYFENTVVKWDPETMKLGKVS